MKHQNKQREIHDNKNIINVKEIHINGIRIRELRDSLEKLNHLKASDLHQPQCHVDLSTLRISLKLFSSFFLIDEKRLRNNT